MSQACLKCLILRQEHLKALLVAILNGLHLDGQVLHCLVQVLDHLGELSVLRDQLVDLRGVQLCG